MASFIPMNQEDSSRNLCSTNASTLPALDWKCRECGLINKDQDESCETCKTAKPLHPCLVVPETDINRASSPMIENQRSVSPDIEVISDDENMLDPNLFDTVYSKNLENANYESSFEGKDQNCETLESVPDKFSPLNPIPNLLPMQNQIDELPNRGQSKVLGPSNNLSNIGEPLGPIASVKTSTDEGLSSCSNHTCYDRSLTVYVPDLPPNITDPNPLENMIRESLEHSHKQKIASIRCYTDVGIGLIEVFSVEDRDRLVKVIKKAIIEPAQNITVSFVDQLQIHAYVVINQKDRSISVSQSELEQRWINLYQMQSMQIDGSLAPQFPNIYHITINSVQELIKAKSLKCFSIKEFIVTVYFRAECCFYEDLPMTTTENQLIAAVCEKLSGSSIPKELMHIQYDPETSAAVLITSGWARVISAHNSITIGRIQVEKKNRLSNRLLISDMPKNISEASIEKHVLSLGSQVKAFKRQDHAVLTFEDKEFFTKCLQFGAIVIDGKPLRLQSYSSAHNADQLDIDAETWYGTEMPKHEPDIMNFIKTPHHPIFHYKWNPSAFQNEFQKYSSISTSSTLNKEARENEKLFDRRRHQLRMTVMLNTIGVIKRGRYSIEEKEIKLIPERIKTIRYNHESTLQRGKTISSSEAAKLPFPSTSVRVVNEDCLITYQKLVKEGKRPVILNMANSTEPGGGYRRGDGAQEETLFRRSNYYQSLDMELDGEKPTTRLYCDSKSQLQPFQEKDGLYPMDEFGAIYTSGLTVFRQPETTGYAFLAIPMYDVAAIAMAAYRKPKLQDDKKFLTDQYSIGTRKKIENVFAIAYENKHDSLVLSALGCGAFENPPFHVASIFKSVIEQYAGYFHTIYFAIINDHNTGNHLNPRGNFQPFYEVLDGMSFNPKFTLTTNTMLGPWRILEQTSKEKIKLSDIRICYLKPCHYGGMCRERDDSKHCQEYGHPPLCPNTNQSISCKEKDNHQHKLWFQHREECRYGGECNLVDKNDDHCNTFDHPPFCQSEGSCINMEPDHLKKYRHVPICKHRLNCTDKDSQPEHRRKFRHVQDVCHFAGYCVRFHDEKHFKNEKHPFPQPCPWTPFRCQQYEEFSTTKDRTKLPKDTIIHCSQYSHVCRYGRQCDDKSNEHRRTTIHVARNRCSHEDKCNKINYEDHLNSWSHQDLPDIRPLCEHLSQQCRDRWKPEHIQRYRHNGHDHFGAVIEYRRLNTRIDFIDNQNFMLKAISTYMNLPLPLPIPSKIRQFILALQPVHRCSKVIFESILVHGHVMSSSHMNNLNRPAFVANTVLEHEQIRPIFRRHPLPQVREYAKKFVENIVTKESRNSRNRLGLFEGYLGGLNLSPADNEKHGNLLRALIGPHDTDHIQQYGKLIAKASWRLYNDREGINYDVDKILGTDRHIFAIFGPHFGQNYGDIFLVFKQEVMLHPDANFTPNAGTSFNSGKTFNQRPWARCREAPDGRVQAFHQSKLHCSVPGYEYVAAAELIGMCMKEKKTMKATVDDVFRHWQKTESHGVFEAHLPQLIPLCYIDEVYMPETIFQSLHINTQQLARQIFGDSLHITEHRIDPTPDNNPPGARNAYQSYVNQKLISKIYQRMEQRKNLRGTNVTLAPSQFSEQILSPLNIQKLEKQTGKNANAIYIYWQAMHGDMMITLTAEPLTSSGSDRRDIRCLVAYVAEIPDIDKKKPDCYVESYSYLSLGHPFEHALVIKDQKFENGSRTFYKGCNTDGFLTYCLKLDKTNGIATLSHTGPNSIYCQQEISCQCSKSKLDFNRLTYIYISAGLHPVPIRNLIVTFAPIADFHPSFDKNFKPDDDDASSGKKSSDTHNKPRTPSKERDKSPSFFKTIRNRIGGYLGWNNDETNESKDNDPPSSPKQLRPCRYGLNCRDKKQQDHCQLYSHPTTERKEPCKYGSACYNQNSLHRSKYWHPDENSKEEKKECRYGWDCYDKSAEHRSKYCHPENHQKRSCRYGKNCRDNSSHHRSNFLHPK